MQYRAGFLPGIFECRAFREVGKMPQEKTEGQGSAFWEKNKKALCGALVCAVFAALGGAFLLFRDAPPPAVPAKQEEGGIGVVDLARAEKAHEAYAQLAELQGQHAALAADIERLSRAKSAIKPPALTDEPFRLAAEQKDLQQRRLMAEAQARERRKALAAWEEETKEAFLKKKKALEDAYQNRIVNIEMKIDNREAMFLSEADVKALLKELAALREERGERIRALFAARDEEKRRYLDVLIARDAKSGKIAAANAQEEAAHQKAEAERRNSEALLRAMQGVEIDEILRHKKAALAAKDEEMCIIREHIRKDIESKAAKLALLHHLSIVVAKETDEAADMRRTETDAPALRFSVVAPAALDLTEELIAELAPGNT